MLDAVGAAQEEVQMMAGRGVAGLPGCRDGFQEDGLVPVRLLTPRAALVRLLFLLFRSVIHFADLHAQIREPIARGCRLVMLPGRRPSEEALKGGGGSCRVQEGIVGGGRGGRPG